LNEANTKDNLGKSYYPHLDQVFDYIFGKSDSKPKPEIQTNYENLNPSHLNNIENTSSKKDILNNDK